MGVKREVETEGVNPVLSEERVKTIREEWLKKIEEWKSRNQGWENSESILKVFEVKDKESTKRQYLSELPPFFTFVDMSPDEVIKTRFEDLASRDPKITPRFEGLIQKYKIHRINLNYAATSISTNLGRIAGWFRANNCSLDLDRNFWKVQASEYVQASKTTKRYPTLKEIKEMFSIADLETRTAILLGYHNGLNTGDVAKITWSNINLDFDDIDINGFYHLEHMRGKTGVEHIIVAGPDLLYCLKSIWIAQGKPTEGYVFKSKTGVALEPRYINDRYTELVGKVIKDEKGKGSTFTDLRDSYNQVLKSVRGISDEHRDLLFGHKRAGAKSHYAFDINAVIEDYKLVFQNITVNGFKYDASGKELGEVKSEMEKMKDTIKRLEFELHARDSRMEHMIEQVKAYRDEMNEYKKIVLDLKEKGVI